MPFRRLRATYVITAGLHTALILSCFGAALVQPERSGLLPVVVYFVDLPASLLCEPLRHGLHQLVQSLAARLTVDALVYGILGGAWWLGLVSLASRLFRGHAATPSAIP
jgi:hypothetical protein